MTAEKKKAKPTPMAIGALNKLVIEPDKIVLHLQVDLDTHENRDDVMTLKHVESDYEYSIELGSLQEYQEDWVKLEFINAPLNGSFTLIHDFNDDNFLPQFVFEEVPFEDLGDFVSEFDEFIAEEVEEEQFDSENTEPGPASDDSSESVYA